MSRYSLYLLTASAIVNWAMGLLTSFLPEEILKHLALPLESGYVLIIQIMGAFYLGFGMINYLSRQSVIGGIYNRPILMGNIAYHGTAAIVLAKYILSHGLYFNLYSILMIIYIALGLGFLRLFSLTQNKQNSVTNA